ncbi:MAG: DUF975 family protein [Lachnospiraceae bacterium]|nr:DUF975 family protein [Lachnospiraceae bacterium]
MKTAGANAIVRANARKQLLGNYPGCVFAYMISDFILTTVSGLFRMQMGTSVSYLQMFLFCMFEFILILISGIFLVGQNYLYLNIARGKEHSYRDIWHGFVHYADKIIRIELLITLNVIFRGIPFFITSVLYLVTQYKFWIIFLVLFGIQFLINAITLQITYMPALFLLLESEQADMRQIMEASILLMNGNKWRYFKMLVSFALISILGFASFGIGFLWIGPYYYSARTNFYLDLLRRRRKAQSL